MGTTLNKLRNKRYDSVDVWFQGSDWKGKKRTLSLPIEHDQNIGSVYFHRGNSWERLHVRCGKRPAIAVWHTDPGSSLKIDGTIGTLKLDILPIDRNRCAFVGKIRVEKVESVPWVSPEGKKWWGRYASVRIGLREVGGEGRVTIDLAPCPSTPEIEEISPGGRYITVEPGGAQALVGDAEASGW
uniref:Uncharacterized protein n=1 Tax=Chromera velia CCMP2878 TaxID=1169474 RepID=A0A0G4HW19_9ALVE|eukprot:Cvel_32470.t1-p1 / transcript=Cvel_32470.t1 / gene=Cvel_32470 / organism=Chromera_velia_CCMP2878 / gene_product=hypothetical protein / transcript_product=hypothetical protein / location=Cvel_scaffold5060:5560-6346(+) / protein_length=184 / sequence_SO=supercontig / SO=protein_coding / is_pseudo=false